MDIPIETLKKFDVMNPSPEELEQQKETADLEKKIKAARKSSTFSLKLDAQQLALVKRAAATTGIPWREWLEGEIKKYIFATSVGKPLISGSKKYSNGGPRVTAPSNSTRMGK